MIQLSMKRSFCFLSLLFLLTSCFKDEPKNMECDILEAWVEGNDLSSHFFQQSDMRIANVPSDVHQLAFTVKSQAELPLLKVFFSITPGATIVPANGSAQDFSKGPVVYTVTSEDGAYSRRYTVSFTNPAKPAVEESKMKFDFEHYELNKDEKTVRSNRYYVWYEESADGSRNDNVWATGNGGFILAKPNAQPEDYPSVADANGYEGACVRLTTRDTGSWGQTFKKPIAAGNLFFGEFDPQFAFTNTLLTTKMGIPFDEEPTKVTGYYKYRPGEVFTDKDGLEHKDRVDAPSIYAVFYRNQNAQGEKVVLHGDDIRTNELIVSMAEVAELPATDEWKPFEMTFKSQAPVNAEQLKNRGYSMALVFSSSKTGDEFVGAVGSTLYIDKVEITFKPKEENQ